MNLFSKKDPAASYPINEDATLQATKVIYVKSGSEFGLSVFVADVTDKFDGELDRLIGSGSESKLLNEKAKDAALKKPAMLEFHRSGRLSSNFTVKDTSNAVIAELSGPLLSLGRWTLGFVADSPHSDHDILVRPAGMMSRADEFVKDSIPYYWDILDGRKLCKLYKVMDGKRVEIAHFLGENARARDGVLLLDGEQLDEVVACLTCVVMLNRSESFRA
ncbi:hypothetical protein O988_00280 [Pseudogymnoascus sp. VKM F-3808]|nr:hypothetical protein O988_00280 [Pseudogymnoascus sp. VKM F-3808]